MRSVLIAKLMLLDVCVHACVCSLVCMHVCVVVVPCGKSCE